MTHNYYPGAIARSSPQTALDERDVSTLPTARMPAQTKVSRRVLYLDILRIVAMLAVVCIHTTAGVLYDVSARKTLDWRAAMVLTAGSRWCVPMYVLLSGAFLLTYRRRYTSREFIRSRLLRIGVPFLAWSIIYMIWSAMIVHQTHISTWADVWNQLVYPAYYHLWFFYMLIGLYLATPALS
ncbi:MAG TPA: acyltransferase family protein, partial [Ktedonobacterales bacterium]|nr:acyltransferase family protein [Ktedonobacterales bacterium]